jgi:hypothetical protein
VPAGIGTKKAPGCPGAQSWFEKAIQSSTKLKAAMMQFRAGARKSSYGYPVSLMG